MENWPTNNTTAQEKPSTFGDGLEYFVVAQGENRVLKIPKTKKEKEEILRHWGFPEEEIAEKIELVEQQSKEAVSTIKSLLRDKIIDPKIVGNPIFGEGVQYSQELATPLKEYIFSVSEEEGQKIIEDYIKLVHVFWRAGFADTIFNFTLNNGVLTDKTVAQIDFGEGSRNEEEIASLLKEKFWMNQHSFKRFPEGSLKEFIEKRFTEEFTEEKLKMLWRKDIPESN